MKKFLLVLLALPMSLLAQDASAPPPEQSFYQTLVMIAIALMFFYFILWRPEQKRRKALEEQRSTLKQGDRVQAMGIIGKVVRIKDSTVILKMVDGTQIEFVKDAISSILPDSEDKDDKSVSKKGTE